MTLQSYIWLTLFLIVLSTAAYWTIHWAIHSPGLKEDYTGFRGFLRYGRKLSVNMIVFALAILIIQAVTAPKFPHESDTSPAKQQSLFT